MEDKKLKNSIHGMNNSDTYFLKNMTIRIKGNNPFIWDGSHLGTLVFRNILHSFIYDDKIFCILCLYGHETFCQIREIKTNYPSICDELKSLFHVPKLGTHRVICNNKLYLLISLSFLKDSTIKNGILENDTLKNLDLNNPLNISYLLSNNDKFLDDIFNINDMEFKTKIQDIFLFRDILGLNCSFEKSIIVRKNKKEIIPISFYENSTNMNVEKKIIPETILSKWFDDISLDDVAKRVFNIKKEDDILDKLAFLRGQINLVIERIDRTMIFLADVIIEKLSRRFLIDLRPPITPSWN